MKEKTTRDRFAHQASQYDFPYHWLPRDMDAAWSMSRFLWWGHEYLAVLQSVNRSVLRASPKKVLDFGCGDGRLAGELLAAGVNEVVGVDLVDRALMFARAFNEHYGDRCRFINGRVQDLQDDAFDCIVAMETFEHLPDSEIPSVVEALAARSTSAGILVVSVPTINVPLHPKHERHYSLEMLVEQVVPAYSLQEAVYVHRIGRVEKLLRRIWINKLFETKLEASLKVVTASYRRWCLHATAADGAHLVATFRLAPEE